MTGSVARRLEALGAHRDVVAYAESFGEEPERFWSECPRGDWILAIAIRGEAPRDALARASTDILTLALDHLPEDDAPSRAVLDATAQRLRGGPGPSPEELDALERAAEGATDPAVSLARQAIALVARALGEGGSVEDLALVPALLAQAAAFDAGDCAMMAAASYAQRKSAELARAHLAMPCSIGSRAEP